ncbi:MAG: hypothetical protein GY810_24695 [Aureispira sp.]|nr:hypothetical protein [Aureispira sp.]
MKHIYTTLFLAYIVFSISSCKEKDEWKLPSDVQFSMDIKKESPNNNKLTFSGGHIVLSSFAIEGTRTQGENVNFDRPYPNGTKVSFDANSYIEDLGFDIPQGTYDYLKIRFSTHEEVGSNNIVLNGSYKSGNTTVPIQLEIASKEHFEINAVDNIGKSPKVVLSHNSLSQAQITLDPTYWFQTVSNSMLDVADKTIVGSNQTILINMTNNSTIYYKIIDRIDEEMEAVLNVNKQK